MSRRLPIYLVLDTSGSMFGEPIHAVENGIQTIMAALHSEPGALEMGCISVITFSDSARQVVPLTDIPQFTPPQLTANGCTALGAALALVADCAAREVRKNSPEVKGDWKPMVFILTDGMPTDTDEELTAGIEAFKKCKWGTVVACAAGGDADEKVLKRITENVVRLDTADSESIKAFFQWVSQSITSNSQSVGAGNAQLSAIEQLPSLPAEVTMAS